MQNQQQLYHQSTSNVRIKQTHTHEQFSNHDSHINIIYLWLNNLKCSQVRQQLSLLLYTGEIKQLSVGLEDSIRDKRTTDIHEESSLNILLQIDSNNSCSYFYPLMAEAATEWITAESSICGIWTKHYIS